MSHRQPLRIYLEAQSDRVESVLAAHKAQGRVTGGTVGPRLIRFFLDPAPHVRFSSIRGLADDLALALRVPSIRVGRGSEGVVLEFPNPEPRPVTLLNLLPEVGSLPEATALLGLTDEGVPLLARLSSPEVAHILIAGTTGSGKSILLKTLALSLILTHRPDTLRIMCLDPKGRVFKAFKGAPHLLRPPITEVSETLEALHSLLHAMEIRDRRGESRPHIALFIDELADLILQGESHANGTAGKEIIQSLTRLAQRGREAGIHIVAATQRPSSALLGGLMRANFPLRLVGKVTSSNDALVAAGRGGTDAHLLDGRGDFLAVGGGSPIRFQAAFVSEKEIRREVAELQPSALKALPRPRYPALVDARAAVGGR